MDNKLENDEKRLSMILSRDQIDTTIASPEFLNQQLEERRKDLEWVRINAGTASDFKKALARIEDEIQRIDDELRKRRNSGIMY